MMMVFFSGIQTSVVGMILGIIGFIFIWGLIMLILKALFVYIAGYLGIALLILLAPLFIPLVMFKVTKQYFDKWVRLLVGFTLQPVIVLVFISFSIAAVDLAAFSGDYSVMYRLAGDASRQQGFNLNDYLINHGAIAKNTKTVAQVKATGGNPENASKPGEVIQTGANKGIIRSLCKPEEMAKNAALKKVCDSFYGIRVGFNKLDWDKLAETRSPGVEQGDGATTPGQQIANEVLSAAIFCGIVVFVMNGLFKVIPAMAQDLLGDFAQSPDLFKMGKGNSTLPGFDRIPSLTQSIQQKAMGMVTGRSAGAGS